MAKTRSRISEKEVVLLGLIAEGPIHAYGLLQKMRERHITEWADIGFSSIYRVLDVLTKKRLISMRLEQGGPGAARKVHEITERGRAALGSGVVDFLNDMTPMKMPMSVGLAFVCNGPHPEVLKVLETRAAAVAGAAAQLDSLDLEVHGELPPAAGANARGMDRAHWLGVHLLFDHFRRHVLAETEFLAASIRLLNGVDGSTFFVAPPTSKTATRREVQS